MKPRQAPKLPTTEELPPRIARRISVDPETNCWAWLGTITKHGYGQVSLGGKNQLAHRAVHLLVRGFLPDPPLQLDHLCRNRSCVNPEHLEPVTNLENCRRGVAGGLGKRAPCHSPGVLPGPQATAAYGRSVSIPEDVHDVRQDYARRKGSAAKHDTDRGRENRNTANWPPVARPVPRTGVRSRGLCCDERERILAANARRQRPGAEGEASQTARRSSRGVREGDGVMARHEPWCNRVTGRRFPWDGCDCGSTEQVAQVARSTFAVVGKEPTVTRDAPRPPPTLVAKNAELEARLAEVTRLLSDCIVQRDREHAKVERLREALKPLASAMEGWRFSPITGKDIGRYNYDTGITPAEVVAARDALRDTEPGGKANG